MSHCALQSVGGRSRSAKCHWLLGTKAVHSVSQFIAIAYSQLAPASSGRDGRQSTGCRQFFFCALNKCPPAGTLSRGLQPSARSTRTKVDRRPASRREGLSHVGTAGLESPPWTTNDGYKNLFLTLFGEESSPSARSPAAGPRACPQRKGMQSCNKSNAQLPLRFHHSDP